MPTSPQAEVTGAYNLVFRYNVSGYQLQMPGVVLMNSDGAEVSLGGSGASAQQVQGNAASGAADAGNPVKIGGRYNTTFPTLTNGQRGDVQLTSKGFVLTTIADTLGAAVASVKGISDGMGPADTLYVTSQNLVFDGTGGVYNRMRGDTTGAYSVEKNRGQNWNEAPSQTLAGAATFTGATRDSGIASGGITPYSKFGAFVVASQAGTLRIVGSDDNFATNYLLATQAVVANTPLDVTVPARTRYHRVEFVNGATPQTSIKINAGYSA